MNTCLSVIISSPKKKKKKAKGLSCGKQTMPMPTNKLNLNHSPFLKRDLNSNYDMGGVLIYLKRVVASLGLA